MNNYFYYKGMKVFITAKNINPVYYDNDSNITDEQYEEVLDQIDDNFNNKPRVNAKIAISNIKDDNYSGFLIYDNEILKAIAAYKVNDSYYKGTFKLKLKNKWAEDSKVYQHLKKYDVIYIERLASSGEKFGTAIIKELMQLSEIYDSIIYLGSGYWVSKYYEKMGFYYIGNDNYYFWLPSKIEKSFQSLMRSENLTKEKDFTNFNHDEEAIYNANQKDPNERNRY